MSDRRASRWPARVCQRVGRRGAFLLILGIIFILKGESLLILDLTAAEWAAREHAFRLFDPQAWANLFIAAGILGISSAFVHTRDRRYSDAIGFAAIQGVAVAWSASLWATALWGSAAGSTAAARSGLSWTLVVASVALIAGWSEAPK